MTDLLAADLSAILEFEDSRTGERFGVCLATLLQCLCIAQGYYLVPPFEPDWERAAIPPALRAMSAVPPRQGMRPA